jgi:hypothetical protein
MAEEMAAEIPRPPSTVPSVAAAPPPPSRPPRPPPGFHIPPPFGNPYVVQQFNPDGSVKSVSMERRLEPDEDYDPNLSYSENLRLYGSARKGK